MSRRILFPSAVFGASLACAAGSRSMEMAPPPPPAAEAPPMLSEEEGGAIGFGGARPSAPARTERARAVDATVADDAPAGKDGDFADGMDDGEKQGESAERTRSWFPEAFLWQPLVVTTGGAAEVGFTVPDSLTTWRVLALAHDAGGEQTGAVVTFDSTLPVYVEPVVPGWMFAGDRLSLPVQVMNNSGDGVSGTLEVEAAGAAVGGGSAAMTLAPGSSDLRALELRASGAGAAKVSARFSAGPVADAAEREIPVRPSGKPVTELAGGTLTGTRTVSLPAVPGADPATAQLELVLFGGPLAVVSSELERLSAGGRPVNAAYGFALTGRATDLAAAAGTEVDADELRRVRLLAWQRVVRESRGADAGRAADLLTGLQGDLGIEAAGPVRAALIRALVDGQRADGTWGRRPQATLQEVLVTTAWSARVAPESATACRLRASAALERLQHEAKDPFTAAALLASGVVDGAARDALRATLLEAVRRDGDRPTIDVPAGVVDTWGVRPSAAEVSAMAVLALADATAPEEVTLRGDLAAALLAGWSSARGFGAGPADALVLEAVVSALPASAGASTVSVTVDGEVVASGRFDPKRPGEPLVLQAPAPAGTELELRAEPPVAGVAFVATRRAWTPWSAADRAPGVDVDLTLPRFAVGTTADLVVDVLAPSNRTVTVEVPLPAGATPDRATLAAANPSLPADRLWTAPDRVGFTTAPFQPASVQRLVVPITPAFAGDFGADPILVSVDGAPSVAQRPVRLTVAGAPGT